MSFKQIISVCICTQRRPRLLGKLLESINELNVGSGFGLNVVTVDNDPLGSAEVVIRRIQHRWAARYLVESKPGIAAARNAALKCSAGSDWVAFVDDDEVVTPHWLTGLLDTAVKFRADVVGGPVIPIFADGVPKWFIEGGFAQRPRFKTGENPTWLGTGNVLISRKALLEIGGFDERFSLTGGEDTEFFVRARRSGIKIIWCNEAVAYEHIGSDRGNMRRQLWRAYHDAALWSVIERLHDRSLLTRVSRVLKAAAYAVEGTMALFMAIFRGRRFLTRGLEEVCEGFGMIAGLMNLISQPYRPAPGLPGEK